MAIFGRKTARQRLRRATRESLKIPAFSSPVDCTPWVIGGLWPAELSTTTAETALLADYLKADLQRIANSANEELRTIRRTRMADSARQAEEERVIKGARSFAVRRVESTLRHLRNEATQLPTEYRRPNGAEDTREMRRLATAAPAQAGVRPPTDNSPAPSRQTTEHRRTMVVEPDDARGEPIDSTKGTAPVAEREGVEPDELGAIYPSDAEVTEVLEEAPTARHAEGPADDATTEETPIPRHAAPSVDEVAGRAPTARHAEHPVDEAPTEESPAAAPAAPPVDTATTARPAEAPVEPKSDRERLQRLMEFVARQEPGLRWAVGDREDGTTVLVTDLAHGWIPPGITLPAGVRLLEPARRTGNAAALSGPTTQSATYAPGDPLGWATDFDMTEPSVQPRELPAVDDLRWVLSEATHWRDGLPRMVHTLAKAGAAGTGVAEAEIDVLRVHLDTARYQLLAQYPDVDAALLLNCLLLAATESIATGDRLSANYHFAWFQVLSAPPASKWGANR